MEYDLRVTVVDSSGKVLADSHADPLHIGGTRQPAGDPGGFGVRHRGRTAPFGHPLPGHVLLHLAAADGRVARFSRPINSIYAIFFSTLPALCFVLAAVFLLAWAVARMLTGRILAPVEGEAQHLKDSLLDGVEYRATRGFMRNSPHLC